MPLHLLKSTPVEPTPPVAVLPPNTVEIEVDDVMEQVDIHYEFQVIHRDGESDPATDCFVQLPKEDPDPCNTPTKSGKRNNKLVKKGGKEFDSPASRKSLKQDDDARLKLPEPVFHIIEDYQIDDAPQRPNNAYIRYIEKTAEELAETTEYDLDEQDFAWLGIINEKRSKERVPPVTAEVMEFTMDRLEKESYFQMQSSGIEQGPLINDDAVCCICMDGECQNANAILFCDMCNLAVHQECYGVPYIPEGQWLCRRCYLSPSIAVDCVLCPNKGGAFKQTECKHWAHVVCAIWIPEVCFANTVFLEPIDNISSIPPARWRLGCFICKQKGVGACIQCYKSNCYTAFHVTCAQQAGLCMRMETVRLSTGLTVKKTAYCDTHAPPDFIAERDNGSPTARQKLKQTRKVLAEKRCAPPVVSVPTIPSEKLAQISSSVTLAKKPEFMRMVIAYWKLKRMERNGVPLLRRLQIASNPVNKSSRKLDPSQSAAGMENFGEIYRVRQDLEKSRLLCELTRKREKLKREAIYLRCMEWDMKIQPFNYFLVTIVDEMFSKDSQSIFTQPVDPTHVPDYLTVVTQPMDLSTMRKKIFEFDYPTIEDMEQDFQLMIDNCLLYNSPDTVFYRAALKMQEFGGLVFREAKRRHKAIGFELSGIMTKTPPAEYYAKPVAIDEGKLATEIDQVLEDKSRYDLAYEEHISLLEQMLDKSILLSHPMSKKKKFLRIKNEIVRLKKRKRLVDSGENPVGDISSMDEDDVAPSPSILGGEIVDSSDAGEEGESGAGARSSIVSKYSTMMRRRLRSTEQESQQQTVQSRISRRLSRSSEAVALAADMNSSNLSPDIVSLTTSTASTSSVIVTQPQPQATSPVTSRPRRGRPPKALSARGRGGRGRGRGRPGLSIVRGAASNLRQQRLLHQPSIRRGISLRGRPRGRGRGARPLRRSDRVVKLQLNAQNEVGSPEKEGEQQQGTASRQGSPVGRNASPRRLSRNSSPTHVVTVTSPQISSPPHRKTQQARKPQPPSPILGSPMKPHQMYMLKKKPKPMPVPVPVAKASPSPPSQILNSALSPNPNPPRPGRGRPKSVLNISKAKLKVLSPKTMEAAAKSIVCEDRPSAKVRMAAAKGGKLGKLLGVEPEPEINEPARAGRKALRGGASRVGKRNSAGKDSILAEESAVVSSPSPSPSRKNRVLPQRKARGPAAARGRRNKVTSEPNGPLVVNPVTASEVGRVNVSHGGKGSLLPVPVPVTNGLPLSSSPKGSPGKKRQRAGGAGAAVANSAYGASHHNVGGYNNSLVGSSLYQSPSGGLMRKTDSFSVYRSGGDHDINSYSEGESGNDDEDDELEEEEVEEEEEGELDDDDDDDSESEEEEPGEPSGPQEQSSDEEENEDEEGDGQEEEDSSGSDSSSSSDDDSSSSSSSSSSKISSSSSGSAASKASSSSSITTPKHFHPTKNKKRRCSTNRVSSANAQSRLPVHQSASAPNHVVSGVSSPASSPSPSSRTVQQQQQQLISPTLTSTSNNNNNVLCSNKEWDKDFDHTEEYGYEEYDNGSGMG